MSKLEVVTPTPKHASRHVWVCDEDGTVAELRNDARGLAYAKKFAAVDDLLAEGKRLVEWLDRLAAKAESSAKTERFSSLKDAYEFDARNYRASAKAMKAAIAKAEPPTQEAP